jgi:molybdate transport system permease protein
LNLELRTLNFLSLPEWQAIRLTLLVAFTAVAASLPLAIALGWLLAKRDFPGKFLVETAVNLPLVLPPVVTGYLLLVAFGRNGWLGQWLEQTLGLRFVFDWKGAALASAVVGFPLLIRPIRQAFAAVDERLVQAARTLGAGPLDAFWTVLLPLSRPGIISGCVLAFARSMGEFGATIMIAGNIPGVTRTMPLMIYTLLDSPRGEVQARGLVLVSIVIAAAALLAGELLERYGRSRLRGATG